MLEQSEKRDEALGREASGVDAVVIARHMLGRCSNGAELDSGRLSHAVEGNNWKAVCGAEPGRRSAGWAEYADDQVTCPRCLRKMKAQ